MLDTRTQIVEKTSFRNLKIQRPGCIVNATNAYYEITENSESQKSIIQMSSVMSRINVTLLLFDDFIKLMQIALKLQLNETYWITKDEKVITHYLLNKILAKKIEKCQKT